MSLDPRTLVASASDGEDTDRSQSKFGYTNRYDQYSGGNNSQDEDSKHLPQDNQNEQIRMDSIRQDPRTTDQVYLSHGFQVPPQNFPNLPNYNQGYHFGYVPETIQPIEYNGTLAMQPMHSGYAPVEDRMERRFDRPNQFGYMPNHMVQLSVPNFPPNEGNFSSTVPLKQESTEEQWGTSLEDLEDDVPLMIRLQQRSISRTGTGRHKAPNDGDPHLKQMQSSDAELLSTSLRHEESESGSDFQPVVAPKGKGKAKASTAANTGPMDIDWRLERFDATYRVDNEGWSIATVSLPGMVREDLFLAPDHPEDEFRLIQTVFLPSQRSRVDDIPRVALLNFHTMTVLVLDVVATTNRQFGLDEPEDAEIKIDPLTFDADEIFLSAMDNWRIGLACGRKNFQLVRGVQEFFDVAMEIVYFIKDHGLVQKKPRERKERSDKGVKRGARMAPNELQPRKKPKTVPSAPSSPAPVKKSKTAKTAAKTKATKPKAPNKSASKTTKKVPAKANTKTKVTKGKVGRPSGKTAGKRLPKGPKGHIKG